MQELDDSNFPKEFHGQQTNGFGLDFSIQFTYGNQRPKVGNLI